MSAHKMHHSPELLQAMKNHGLVIETPSQLSDCFRFGWTAATDLSQAAVAAALQAAAGEVQTHADHWRKAWETAKSNSSPKEARDWQAMMLGGLFIKDSIRALITQPQHDALAAHVAAEVAKARAEDAKAVAYTRSDPIQPASADMSGIDRAMLQSMAASFRGALEFSFNRHDMAELMDRCAASPASADTRTVTVAQLECWAEGLHYAYADPDHKIRCKSEDEIRAIIGDTE